MVLWTEKCFSYHISSVIRPHQFWQTVPLLWGKHEVCCSAASTGQHCATQQDPFRQLPAFGHSTSTSYQDSRQTNSVRCSVWAMKFRSLASKKWLNIKVYFQKNEKGGKSSARRDAGWPFLIPVLAGVQSLVFSVWQWEKWPADSLLSTWVQNGPKAEMCQQAT